ncbi:hypothetical protein GV64_03780 [Endozoicomonas elysicola]|uniref:Uncharacterized protein n=2 Tax=Endozoicomonas elysicola TaxID=305900 RepID=A0A081K756_9GAMM|nr:hypothetical protein GV64_03780 [Endozoicomonas elysicola]
MVVLKRPVQTAGLQNIPSGIQGGQPPRYQLQGYGVQARNQPNPQPSKTTFEHPIKMGMPTTNAHSLFLGNQFGRSPSFSSQASLTHQSHSSSYHGTPSCQYSTGSTYIGEGHNLANVRGVADSEYLSGQLLSLKDVQPEIHQQALDQANPASAKQTMVPPSCGALAEVSQPYSVRSNQEPTIPSTSSQAPNLEDSQRTQNILQERVQKIVLTAAKGIAEKAGVELQDQIEENISTLAAAINDDVIPSMQEKMSQKLDETYTAAFEKISPDITKQLVEMVKTELQTIAVSATTAMQESLNQGITKTLTAMVEITTPDLKEQREKVIPESCQHITDTMLQNLEKQLIPKIQSTFQTVITTGTSKVLEQHSQHLSSLYSELETELNTTISGLRSLKEQMITDAKQHREDFQRECHFAITKFREVTESQLKLSPPPLTETSSARGNGLPDSKLQADSQIGTPIALHQQDTDASGEPPRKKMSLAQPAVEPENLTPESTGAIHATTSCLQKNKASELAQSFRDCKVESIPLLQELRKMLESRLKHPLPRTTGKEKLFLAVAKLCTSEKTESNRLDQVETLLRQNLPKSGDNPNHTEIIKRNEVIKKIKDDFAYEACELLLVAAENSGQLPVTSIHSLLQIAVDKLKQNQPEQAKPQPESQSANQAPEQQEANSRKRTTPRRNAGRPDYFYYWTSKGNVTQPFS